MLVFITITSNAQNWLTTLNSGATTVPRLGLSTNHPLSFLTNNVERMTLTNTGRLGIGIASPLFTLDVVGDTRINGKLLVGKSSTEAVTMTYSAGNATTPAFFRFGVPVSLQPLNGNGSGATSGDPRPNLACLTGSLPGIVNAFHQALSISYNPTNTAVTGGQLLMGHNGYNAFLETQGTGTLSGANNPGDLFINKFCNRNVMFFQHATPFAIAQTKVVSIDGSLNVRSNMQLGDAGQTFADATSKLYILNSIGVGNGIRVKHGINGTFGIKIATYNDATAFVISKSATSGSNDGNESFKIEGDGQTTITTTNTTAFTIKPTAITEIFKVMGDGQTTITTTNTTAFTIKPTAITETFKVLGNGQTFIGSALQQTTGAMFTVGQSNKTALALSLTDNGFNPNRDFFNVYGNGYVEIKVSPSAMTTPTYTGVTGARVFTIRDVSNSNVNNHRDLFAVRADGKVYAREVEINNVANFPDYVFDKNYPLKPITEVDTYIQKNKHLPGFESADHYEKNGLNVGDLFLKQQEKIEELMLYVIELEKRLKAVEKSK